MEELCHLKKWSSDTELCKPTMVPTCEQMPVKVKKIRKSSPMCKASKIPKCKVSDAAEEVNICTTSVTVGPGQIFATLYEQEMIKRCNTHYVTECQPSYGYQPPVCNEVPIQVLYYILE